MKQSQVWKKRPAGLTENLGGQPKSWLSPCLQNAADADRKLVTITSDGKRKAGLKRRRK